MGFFKAIEKTFRLVLPTPFSIALILTVISFFLALFLTDSSQSGINRIIEITEYWEKGLWDSTLLVFAIQMMLMLVLGHTLALTPPISRLIGLATKYCSNNARAAAIVTLLTILVALFNWGLGLIFGAILARKVGEHARKNKIPLNYPLIGAAGYSGLMVWHGGISGSAPIKAAESGHLKSLMKGILDPTQINSIPSSIPFSETVFGNMNLFMMMILILCLPLFMYFLGKKSNNSSQLPSIIVEKKEANENHYGAEKIDKTRFLSLLFGSFIIVYIVYSVIQSYSQKGLGFINPNFINLLLLGLCLAIHKNIHSFLKAIDNAIGGASGILIQFPLYFGIMGIMNGSGLVDVFSDFFVSISNETTFPIFSFISAGIVNIFVPSGGGQWGVQGPILIQAALDVGVEIPKSIMALSYGDQLTNMLQPFWALPLLGITGLKAKEILPYTFSLMCVGAVLFVSVLLIF